MYRRQRYTSLPDRYVAPAICTASLTDMKQGRYVAPQRLICSALGAISLWPCPNAVLAAEASSKRGTARTGSTSRCAASRSTAAPAATPRGGRRRRVAATSTGEAAGRRCRSMSRSWTRRMRAHPARPPKARSTRRWLAFGPCWKTRVQTRGASLARRVGQSCGSGRRGRRARKWWTTSWRVSARRRCPRQATRSCPSAAPPTCGARWRAMPRSTTSALRRATSALRTVRCSRAAPRSPPLTPAPCPAAGLHQLTTRTMYVRSGVGLIG